MARLPKFLNLSAAGRVRLALPAAKLALIAFSCTLAVVGMGAFVATLPALSADGSIVDAAERDASGGEKRGGGDKGEATEGESADEDAAEGAEGEGADQGGSGDAAQATGSSAAVGGAATSGSGPASGASSPATSGSSSTASSSSAPSDSTSNSSSSSSTSSSSNSNSSSSAGSGSNAATEEQPSSVPDDDPFSKIPTAAEEAEFHSFLASWYAKFPQAEAESRNGDSTIAWDGYFATMNYVRSNYSQWCKSQENMIGAFRCLGEWNGDDANHRDSYNQYLTWKSGISL